MSGETTGVKLAASDADNLKTSGSIDRRVQSDSSQPARDKSVLTRILPIIISSFALIVSISSAAIGYISYRDVSQAQMIRSEYEVFDDFSRQAVNNWQIAHVFALPDTYSKVKRQV